MEFVPLVGPALKVLKVLQETADNNRKIKNELQNGIKTLRDNLNLIKKGIEKYEEQELQELAYEIEDFLPHILTPGRLSFILTGMRLNRSCDQISVIKHLQQKMDSITERGSTSSGAPKIGKAGGASGRDAQLVGDAKTELKELLSAADGELRVVSIVGCSGLGKTALAKALYSDAEADKKFDLQAFVVASECNEDEAEDRVMKKAMYLLRKILQQVRDPSAAPIEDGSNLAQLTKELHTKLENKRYLVAVDDIKEIELWEELKRAFPNNKRSGSRIIVTTSIQSIATDLSHGRYRYKMRGLNDEDSRKLFSSELFGSEENKGIVDSAKSIVSKCNGSPLALVRAARHVKPKLAQKNWQSLGTALGTEISDAIEGSALWELKRSLEECYSSLPKYHDRRGLLSVIMSPMDRQINKNSLLRKWIAEGLVSAHHQMSAMYVGFNSFNEFVGRSIIDTGLTGSNSNVKRYQVQGIMPEFIVHKSTCVTNFATIIDPLIHPDGRLPLEKDGTNHIRRLFISDGTEEVVTITDDIKTELLFIRWLTVCSTRIAFLKDFLPECKLLRVLDLEGCKGFDEKVLANICKLVKSLMYLSLRGSDVKQIPKQITGLVNLETLDIRETKVEKLPMEVLLMPGLAHLFGKFELVGSYKEETHTVKGKKSKVVDLFTKNIQFRKDKGKDQDKVKNLDKGKNQEMKKLFSGKSNLQTLSGVYIHEEEQGFKEFMLHAEKLKKVKIWCKETTSADIIPSDKFSGSKCLESLSVDTGDKSMDILLSGLMHSFAGSSGIRYLKLRGKLPVLPRTFTVKLDNLEELQLSSTGLSWQDLSVLQNMSCLLKLKLVEGHHEFGDESFIVEQGGFISLQQLCIEAQKLPKVQLKEGATPCLLSLELMLTPRQNHTTSEITTSEAETPIKDEAMLDITSAQLHVTTPIRMGKTSEVTTHQKEQAMGILQRVGKMRRRSTPVGQQRVPGHTTQQPENALVPNTPSCQSDTGDESFIPSLDKLCIEAPELPNVQLKKRGTPCPASPELHQKPEPPLQTESIADIELRLGVKGLLHLLKLNEVILHYSTDVEKMQYWEEIANMHINRPYIKKRSPGQKVKPQPPC